MIDQIIQELTFGRVGPEELGAIMVEILQPHVMEPEDTGEASEQALSLDVMRAVAERVQEAVECLQERDCTGLRNGEAAGDGQTAKRDRIRAGRADRIDIRVFGQSGENELVVIGYARLMWRAMEGLFRLRRPRGAATALCIAVNARPATASQRNKGLRFTDSS